MKGTSLKHLDLRDSGLSEAFLMQLVPAFAKSKSLVAVHLCGNEGVTEDLKLFAQEKLKLKEVKRVHKDWSDVSPLTIPDSIRFKTVMK